MARLFREILRDGDVPARVGGEEFAFWLPGAGLALASDVAERVRRKIEETPLVWAGQATPMTCSIGVAAIPETSSSSDNLIAAADAALYRAKRGGRNRVCVATSAVSAR